MALIKCKECKKEISDSAKQCPHCGYKKKKIGFFWPIIMILIIIGYFPHRVRETLLFLVTIGVFYIGLEDMSWRENYTYDGEVSQSGTTIRSGSIQNKARFFSLFPLQTVKVGKTYADYQKEETKRTTARIQQEASRQYNSSYGTSGGRSYSGGGLSGGK